MRLTTSPLVGASLLFPSTARTSSGGAAMGPGRTKSHLHHQELPALGESCLDHQLI